jgi:hypothetical protein
MKPRKQLPRTDTLNRSLSKENDMKDESAEVNTIFFEMPKSPAGGEVVVVSQATFNGFTGLDLRAHYRRKDGTYNRSRKGIRLDPKIWEALVPYIQLAIAAMRGNA